MNSGMVLLVLGMEATPELETSASPFCSLPRTTRTCGQLLPQAAPSRRVSASGRGALHHGRVDWGSCGTACFRRARVVVSDIMTDPLWAPYTAIAARFQLSACWSGTDLSRAAAKCSACSRCTMRRAFIGPALSSSRSGSPRGWPPSRLRSRLRRRRVATQRGASQSRAASRKNGHVGVGHHEWSGHLVGWG